MLIIVIALAIPAIGTVMYFISLEESSEKQFGDGCYLIVDNGAQLGYDLWDYPSPDEG